MAKQEKAKQGKTSKFLKGWALLPLGYEKKLQKSLFLIGFFLFGFWGTGQGQTERWVYRYNGPANDYDRATSLDWGVDGNIYVAGVSKESSDTHSDFIVISLTPEGNERWVYRYDGSAGEWDEANSLVCGADGNIYAAGYSRGIGTYDDFTVISLTPDGNQKWVYQYNGGGRGLRDEAFSVTYGADGNVYAAGRSWGEGTRENFTVISLTSDGRERWVYQYDGPENEWDWANSVIYGADSNIYAAGLSCGILEDFIVISLTPDGNERWVYRYNGSGNYGDVAYSIVYGGDGNLYAAGVSYGRGTYSDFTVISLTPDGNERWVYRYNGPGNEEEWAKSVAYGADGNLYIAGSTWSIATHNDFLVISLTPDGNERWVYRYNGPGNYDDRASSLVWGADGNIYITGWSSDTITRSDITVITLTPDGNQRWVYRYNGLGNQSDVAGPIIYGGDGNLYIAGESRESVTYEDFTVISLNPATGIEEEKGRVEEEDFFTIEKFARGEVKFSIFLSEPSPVNISLYNIEGKKITSWIVPGKRGRNWYRKNPPLLSSGVYFLKVEVRGKEARGKCLFLK